MPGGFMGFETSSGTLEKSVDAAIAHAEIHWKKLMSEKTLRLTEKYDNVLYDAFRSFFPDVSVGKIKRVTFDGMNKSRWKRLERNVMKKMKTKEDTLTMLRLDSRGGYSEDNVVMVSRLQFLCIEVTRNREGSNTIDPKGILVDDLKERKKSMMISFSNEDVRELVKWITQLRVSYPCPDKELLSRSGIAKTLTRINKIITRRKDQAKDGDDDVSKALNLVLSQWRVAIDLFRDEKTEPSLTKRLLSRLNSSTISSPSSQHVSLCCSSIVDKRVDALLRWADKNGASEVCTRIGMVENEKKIRGLGTCRAVRRGEELYRIPLSVALTLDVAIRSDVGPICRRLAFESGLLYTDEGVSLDESGSRFALALLIAHERLKGSQSFWAPWIESLPQHYDCLVAWKDTNEELGALQCPELIRTARRSKRLLRRVWKQIKGLIEDEKTISKSTRLADMNYDIFLWGYLTIESRALSFGRRGRQRHPFGNSKNRTESSNCDLDNQIAVCPVFDLMNHESHSSSPSFRFETPRRLSYPDVKGFTIPVRVQEPLPPSAHATYRDALKASQNYCEENARKYDPENGFRGLNEDRFGKAPAQCVTCKGWSSLEESANEDLWIFENFYCLCCTTKENKEDEDKTDWLPSDLSIVASRDYVAGEPIMFSYGRQLCSQDLLIRYGFLTSSPSFLSRDSVAMLEMPERACEVICRRRHGQKAESLDSETFRRLTLEMSYDLNNTALSVPPVPKLDLEKRCFWASSKFRGSRTGYYFGSGMFGLGYYTDVDSNHGPPIIEHVFGGDMRCVTVLNLPFGVGQGWSHSMSYFRYLVDAENHADGSEFISLQNETAALRLFRTFLSARLNSYETSLEQDCKAISTNARETYRKYLALMFRIEQKTLIESHLKCLNLTLELLSQRDLSVSQLLKYDRGSLDESTMAEIILYVLRCLGKLHCIPSSSSVENYDDESNLFIVESVMGVVNQ